MMKAKKFRRRADDDDDADGDESEKVVVKPVSEKSGKEKGKEKSVPKTGGPVLLSFAEDDEYADSRGTKTTGCVLKSGSRRDKSRGKPAAKPGDTSLLSFEDDAATFVNGASTLRSKKKSGFGADKGSGPKLGFGRDKSLSNSSAPSNVQPHAGEYTKEKLAELQRNTIRLGAPAPPPVDNKSSEPVVVLKGLVKPAGITNGSLGEGNEHRESLGQSNISDVRARIDKGRERDESDRLKRDKDDAESRLGLMGIGIGAESGGITHIPDAAAIAAAKAKRERLRQAQAAPDYISLATGDGADLRSKLRESAFGVDQDDDGERREDDDSSADEAEVQGRLAFLGDTTASQKNRAGGVFDSVEERAIERGPLEEQGDEDDEDEDRRWEEEQLRKGVGKRVDEATNRSAAATTTGPSQAPNSGFGAAAPTSGSGWGWGQSSEKLSIQQQAEAAMAKLQEDLTRMKEKHIRTEAQFARTQDYLESAVKNVSTLERTLTAAGDKYLYMQKLRDYISILCDFLQDKAPLIEELEEHMQRLHEERANAVTERRVGDHSDELAEVEAAVGAAKAVFSKGGGTATALSAAAAAAFSARDASNLGPQLDEFGRDVNLQKRMESKRHAQARAKRAAKAASRRTTSLTSGNGDGVGSQRVEGESSSDESESEATAYQSRREEVLDTTARIFGDAIEDYAQLRKVKETLETWKSRYPAAYRDGYVSLSAPSIFAPFVRLELLQWDPLYGDAGFTNMDWYKLLSDYGMPQDGKEPEEGDLDGDIVPKLVEKVALPILHHEIAHCWDRLSTQGTRRAVIAVEDILVYVPASSEPLQELMSAVRNRMADAVSTLDVPTWSLQVINAVPQAARFSAQKFGTALRLLRNIGMWKNVLALSLLEELALDKLLSAKILPHLRTLRDTLHDAVTRTERVISALDRVWLGSPQLSPKLASLVEYMTTLTRLVEKKKDSGASVDDTVGLARRVKVMLVKLNEYDRAHQLAKHFQLKEAL
ncbi:unnamed protein product [Calypogeia fissa]